MAGTKAVHMVGQMVECLVEAKAAPMVSNLAAQKTEGWVAKTDEYLATGWLQRWLE